MMKSRENAKNRFFRHISGIFSGKRIFLKNRSPPCFEHCRCAFLRKKSEKTNDEISRKCLKTGFSGIFGRKIFFFENRIPSLSGDCHFEPLCQKLEKTNEPIPRKAGNRRTNERTDEHWLI